MEPSTPFLSSHQQVVAALIAAVVSAIAAVLAFVGSRWQLRAKLLELDLKRAELESTASAKLLELDLRRKELDSTANARMLDMERAAARLQVDADAVKQTLLRDVLVKRMAAYTELWRLFITYERNWALESRPLTVEWASEFFLALNVCNANHGVFFSQEVYVAFYEYRARLLALKERAQSGAHLEHHDLDRLVEVSTTGIAELKMQSLGGAIKDDLGSYMRVAIRTA